MRNRLTTALRRYLAPTVRDQGAEPEGIANHPDELVGLHASLHILCKDVADTLVRHYPGFLWSVAPDQRGQIINIYCLNFHDEYGYTIRTAELDVDPRRRLVIKAGQELLRRFRYPGVRYDAATANAVPRDYKGRAIPDLSDMKSSRRRDQSEADLALAEGRATILQLDGETILRVDR